MSAPAQAIPPARPPAASALLQHAALSLPPAPEVRLELEVDLRYEIVDPRGADFILQIHAAQTPQQTLFAESLRLSPPQACRLGTDPLTGNRSLRLHAGPGELRVAYTATVELSHHRADPATLAEEPIGRLPDPVLPYLYPSRYCPSDLLLPMALQTFGHLPPGHARVQAVQDWVRGRLRFAPATSHSGTSALDSLASGTGVCRDFAHLMIAMCRALNLPARFATGTDYGADPALGSPDFHAYVEVWLGGRWYLFDPSGTAIPQGLMRLATGRDAADVAFATVFGGVRTEAPRLRTRAVDDPSRGLRLPQRGDQALSTAAA